MAIPADRSIWLELSPDQLQHPELLNELERWLQLGLLSALQVEAFCQIYLSCAIEVTDQVTDQVADQVNDRATTLATANDFANAEALIELNPTPRRSVQPIPTPAISSSSLPIHSDSGHSGSGHSGSGHSGS
nr:hypothetical protein [Elainella sp. Prado103]